MAHSGVCCFDIHLTKKVSNVSCRVSPSKGFLSENSQGSTWISSSFLRSRLQYPWSLRLLAPPKFCRRTSYLARSLPMGLLHIKLLLQLDLCGSSRLLDSLSSKHMVHGKDYCQQIPRIQKLSRTDWQVCAQAWCRV